MNSLTNKLEKANWKTIAAELNQKGYAVVPKILAVRQCTDFITQYDNEKIYRKTISMERYRFGYGEYKYFDYPLPGLIQTVREIVYPRLATVANTWMKELKINRKFPDTFQELKNLCFQHDQTKSTPLILKYEKGGFNTLHQDLYGEIFFPLQTVFFLSDPESDYSGGEFILVQQNFRAQSKVIVLKPRQGDMLIFTTNFRPVKGSRGHYKVTMKHGVSELHDGKRFTLGIIFHDALT